MARSARHPPNTGTSYFVTVPLPAATQPGRTAFAGSECRPLTCLCDAQWPGDRSLSRRASTCWLAENPTRPKRQNARRKRPRGITSGVRSSGSGPFGVLRAALARDRSVSGNARVRGPNTKTGRPQTPHYNPSPPVASSNADAFGVLGRVLRLWRRSQSPAHAVRLRQRREPHSANTALRYSVGLLVRENTQHKGGAAARRPRCRCHARPLSPSGLMPQAKNLQTRANPLQENHLQLARICNFLGNGLQVIRP